jgi:16S rRNA (adenine1518-N6/adenine1519-N6)-dimethyltransferase
MARRIATDTDRMKEGQQFNNPSPLQVVQDRLEMLDIEQDENLGQHFLIDEQALKAMVNEATRYSAVIEVGAGVGQLTERLAQVSPQVIAIEIDQRFEPVLAELQTKYPHLSVVYADALACGLERRIRDLQSQEMEVQIIANLPYHITEPFMQRIAALGIPVSLMVGERFSQAATRQNPHSPEYTSLSLLCQSFFDVEIVERVPREAFLPEPRTESSIVRFTPKREAGIPVSKMDFIVQRLFLTANKSPLLKNVIKEALIAFSQEAEKTARTKTESHRYDRRKVKQDLRRTVVLFNAAGGLEDEEPERGLVLSQNQAREIIAQLGIPDAILEKPFSQLNNIDIRNLVIGLSNLR